MPSQRRRDVPVQVPLRYRLVGGSAVAVSVPVPGFGPAFSSPLSLSWGSLVTSASTGPGGEPVAPRRAAGAPCPPAPWPPSRLGGRAWRRPASPRARQDRPAVASTACALRCDAACVVAGTSRPPPAPAPADWVALRFPLSARNETNRGPMAWRQPGKLRPAPTRRPASTPPPPPWVLASAPGRRGAGAVERVDDHTKHP